MDPLKIAQINQALYIKHHKIHHIKISCFRFLFALCFLGLWEISTYYHWIDRFFFSSPSIVVKTIIQLFLENNLLLHTGITLAETIVSFLLVTILSLLFATLLWFSELLTEISEPYLVILNALPKSALAPLFIVWLGTGMDTIIVAGISVAIFGSILNIFSGFCQIDSEKKNLIRTLGGNKWDMFKMVVLPGSLPYLLSTLKVNIGLSLVGVIIGEFLAARRGLGYLIIYGSQVFQLHMVIASIIILCFIAFSLYRLLQSLEHQMKKRW